MQTIFGSNMALITCSECGKEISDSAQHCVGCGAPVQAGISRTLEKSSEDKGGGNWIVRIAIAGGLFWLFFTSSGSDFITSFLKSFNVETDISKYDCQKASTLVKGESLQNAFGARYEIISISDLSEVSKSSEEIKCTGLVDLSNGKTQAMLITVSKGANSSEIRYQVEPL